MRDNPPTAPRGCSSLPALRRLEDEALAAELVAGHHDALTVLFERYSAIVFRIARRILRDSGEAEEAVQQVFLDIYRSADQFCVEKGPFRAWLLRFAYHRTINRKKHLSAKGFYTAEELDERELPTAVHEKVGKLLRLSSQDVACLVEQVLTTIELRQRRVIELTFFEGLTAEEISNRTGETPSVVRHNLYRGLSKLREAILQNEDLEKRKAKGEVEGISFAYPRTF
jgi:RNA polymerase sigma-70 factor (ECF subfamily)